MPIKSVMKPVPALTNLRRARLRTTIALGALLAAGVAVSPPAHPEAAKPPCAVVASPEIALSRLNAARVHGAVCHRAGEVAVAAPLRWSASLAAVAAAQAREMAALNRMDHRDSHDRGLIERLGAMGYRFSAAAENVAVGYASLDAVVDAWLDSEAHCDNLMNAKVLELGLACSDSSAGADPGEGRYWTLVLGAPKRSR